MHTYVVENCTFLPLKMLGCVPFNKLLYTYPWLFPYVLAIIFPFVFAIQEIIQAIDAHRNQIVLKGM